jgi:hypothetical protein
MKLKSKLSFAVLVINFMIDFIFPLGESCKYERFEAKGTITPQDTNPLGG